MRLVLDTTRAMYRVICDGPGGCGDVSEWRDRPGAIGDRMIHRVARDVPHPHFRRSDEQALSS